MLKLRLFVLAAMLCLLALVASKPANADAYCSCAMTCGEGGRGGPTCEASCEVTPGTSDSQVWAAAMQCCQGAADAPPLDCPASGPTAAPAAFPVITAR